MTGIRLTDTTAGALSANDIGQTVTIEVRGGAVVTDTLTSIASELDGSEQRTVALGFKNVVSHDSFSGFQSRGFIVPTTQVARIEEAS